MNRYWKLQLDEMETLKFISRLADRQLKTV